MATSVMDNYDLASIIIHHVLLGNASSDLLSLSLTSRPLSNLALDYLWRKIPSSYHILKLLPGFDLVDNVYTMTRKLDGDDWGSFDCYSPRIHEIICLLATSAYGVRQSIDPRIFETLQGYRPHIPLLPSIRFLKTPKHLLRAVSSALVVMPLMTPMMQKISLYASNPSVQEYLKRLSHLGSQLRVIRITGRHSLALTNAVTSFKHLESLDLNFHWTPDYFDAQPECPDFAAFLNRLSDLENLTSLLMSPPMLLGPRHSLSTTRFKRLKRLAVTGNIQTFIDLCRMAPYIEYLVLEMPVPEDHTKWLPLFEMLQTSCPLLRNLRIYGRYNIGEKPMSVLNHLKPLSGIPLTGLCVKSGSPLILLTLSDSDVEEMTGFWPQLSNLEIFPDGRYVAPNVPLMKALKIVLVGCIALRYLHIGCRNKPTKLYTRRSYRSTFTLDNVYPPFVEYGLP